MVNTNVRAEGNSGSALSLSGLLNSLDWIESTEGRCVSVPIAYVVLLIIIPVFSDRLLFITTNHVERLDPALSRPGRMDIWVNFAHASKWQAEWIFQRFFLPSRSSALNEVPSLGAPRENLSTVARGASTYTVPMIEEAEIVQLAQRFADAIPEGEMSV